MKPGESYPIEIGMSKVALEELVLTERTAAAQAEWERWKRANGVAATGIRVTIADLRALAKRVDISVADERDLLRSAETLEECAVQLDGENWLRSPLAMAEQRARER